jgi:CDP-glucose 4,6-dehydratase
VAWIADTLIASWGEGASWTCDDGKHPSEAQLLRLDTSKSMAGLGWYPVLPLTQGLEWIVEWYQAFRAGDDVQSFTRGQIERYEHLLRDRVERDAAALSNMVTDIPLLSTAEG